jgi:GNAT superfamily N-acetyltransferase
LSTEISHTLAVDENPSEEDLRYVLDSIRQFNRKVSGHERPRSVACFVRDEQGTILGGVQGDLWGSSMHISGLWVAKSERRKGHGAALMAAIENYAQDKGHRLVYLETTNFQALPFYEKLGYRMFGHLAEIAEHCTLFFLKKNLTS